jgi:DNA-binding NtrC family response regulator
MRESVSQKIFVVDDDVSVREALERLIRSAGLSVRTFATAHEGLANLQSEMPNCLVLDVQLPDINGLELQQELAIKDLQIPIIFLTGYGDIPTSVQAIKAGAVDFLTKPFTDEYLLEAIRNAIRRDNEIGETIEVSCEIIGQSRAYRQVISQLEIVAPTDATVLILGETGTGKELIAREIHRRSQRTDRPLVEVNCTSIPKELFESEFFGHSKGAFTGAVKDRSGRFEAATGGTLFLDEVGEIPLELQSKLLRVLQEKCYERIGEDRTRRTDVRIVAATNRDLQKEAAAGRFREDLYYRLNVFPLRVAALRERKEDIPLLATHFVELSVKELGSAKPRLTPAGIEALQNYHWPGNIRELRNVIERAVILAWGGALEFDLQVSGSSAQLTLFEPRDGGRDVAEYITKEAHIDGSVLLPLGDLNPEELKRLATGRSACVSFADPATARAKPPRSRKRSDYRAFTSSQAAFSLGMPRAAVASRRQSHLLGASGPDCGRSDRRGGRRSRATRASFIYGPLGVCRMWTHLCRTHRSVRNGDAHSQSTMESALDRGTGSRHQPRNWGRRPTLLSTFRELT